MTAENPHYLRTELHGRFAEDSEIVGFLQSHLFDGIWLRDLESPEHQWVSEGFWELLGYDPLEMPHRVDTWHDAIFEDDRWAVTDNLNRHCLDPSHPFDQVVRFRHFDGSLITVRCRGVAIRDGDGHAVRMLGAHTDLTGSMRRMDEGALEVDFLSKLGHDVRTPLNSVLVITEALQATDLSPDQAEMLRDLMAAGQQLNIILAKGLCQSVTGVEADVAKVKRARSLTGLTDQQGSQSISAVDRLDLLPQGFKLIVVEDVLLNRNSLRHSLAASTVSLTFATNGAQAYEIMTQLRFDAALIDIRMPGMSGVELIQAYRAFERENDLDHLFAIAFSANVSEGQNEQYRAAGFDQFLPKPFDLNTLIDKLMQAVHAGPGT